MAAGSYTQFMVAWYPCAARIFAWTSNSLAPTTGIPIATWQQQQLNPANTVPLDVRPLRMSLRLRNTTQNLNLAGAVTCVQVPQSLQLTFQSANNMNPATIASLWNLCASSPQSYTLTGKELTKPHTFVSAPSSFVAYNSYSDWVALTATSDGGQNLALADWQLLFTLQTGITPIFPYTPPNGLFGTVPASYITLLNFEPNSLQQTYEFEMFCQDGVRYPANSMAAAVATRATASAEHSLTEAAVNAAAAAAADQFVHPADSISQVGSAIRDFVASDIGVQGLGRLGRTMSSVMQNASAGIGGIANAILRPRSNVSAMRMARVAKFTPALAF